MRALSCLGLIVLFATPARADWPMARHDPQRTGAAAGKSDLTKPVPYWRTYLGGSLYTEQFAHVDVDGDGKEDLLFSTSGRVVAKSAQDETIWETKPAGVYGIIAIADVDGDGKLDIVCSAQGRAVIFAAATGDLEWAEPDGEMGTLSRVVVADFDGDGKPDVLTMECGCCGVNSGKTGFARSFAAGFASPTLLWTLPAVACGGGRGLTTIDVDGDGKLELALILANHVEILRGADGMVIATSATLGTNISYSYCYAGNVDGVTGEELVCTLTSPLPPATDQRKIFLVKFDGSSMLTSPWKVSLAPDNGDVALINPIADLDGDGQPELVASGFDPGTGKWTTHILDPATGADLVTALDGQEVAGYAQLEVMKQHLLIATTTSGVAATAFARTPTPTTTQRWTLPNVRPMQTVLPDPLARGSGNPGSLLATDLTGDGLDELVMRSTSGPSVVTGYTAANGVPTSIGQDPMPTATDVLSMWPLAAAGFAEARLAIGRSDGILNLLDKDLMPLTTGGEFSSVLAIRVGGYYAQGNWRELTDAARTGALKSGDPDAVLVGDSRGALLRFDPKTASWATPPKPTWTQLQRFAPTIVQNLDGTAPGIACFGFDGSSYTLNALRADGTSLWSVMIDKAPLNDILPGNLNGDATPDLVMQWGDPGDVLLQTRAYSGTNGGKEWDAPALDPGAGRQPAGVALGDYNGDGYDDVYTQGPKTTVFSGVNGASLASAGVTAAYFLPLLVDTNGDSLPEVMLQGGYGPTDLMSHDLMTALWASADDDRPYPYGAVATCPNGPILVEGSLQHTARLKLTPLSGAALGMFTTYVLAGGQRFADEASASGANAYMGQLTAVAVHANLTGTGHPTAIVGSSDGYLYGVNPCDGSIDFTVSLGVAVGEAIFADTDGDGRDEILVGAADGYLYGIKNQNIAQPTNVIDLDPDTMGTTDVDIITSTTRLAAQWDAVPNATSYEVTAVGDDGVALAPWQDVGGDTQYVLQGLTLTVGAHYTFAVRARSSNGPSVDALSNGVTIALGDQPDGGDVVDAGGDGGGGGGEGCGCELGGREPASPWIVGLVLFIAGVLLRRRDQNDAPTATKPTPTDQLSGELEGPGTGA